MPVNLFKRICYLITLSLTCAAFIIIHIGIWMVVVQGKSDHSEQVLGITGLAVVTFFVDGVMAFCLYEGKDERVRSLQRK